MSENDETSPKGRDAPPRASAMVEALRGLGYSAATAIADIIDNSISAHADKVELHFGWRKKDSFITILDNGTGMDDGELDTAMRLGELSPDEVRRKDDLGRFGLGLKTASFSQARRLTVSSRRDGGEISTLRWDLDVLRADRSGRWTMLEGAAPGSGDLLAPLQERARGTLVLWEQMDRIVPPGSTEQDFLDLIDRVEAHLAMVFHRYLDSGELAIVLNGKAIAPWDPFLEARPDTWRSGLDRFLVNGSQIAIEGYVLPHKDRLSAKVWEQAAGPHGWTAQQGFYVYRNRRLLVAGHWLGLGQGRAWTKEEAFRLARIRLDLPNDADADWKIDIRKSTARPPLQARARLSLFAENVRERARRVFAFRGKPQRPSGSHPLVHVWNAHRSSSGMRYRIDKKNPVVATVLEAAGALKPDVEAMLRVIEETVPVQQIWLDVAEGKDTPTTAFEDAPPGEVVSVMQTIFRNLVIRKGLSEVHARQQLANMEPFDSWPKYIETLSLKSED